MPKSHPGNKHGLKLKQPDIRQEAYRQYCKHLEDGWPKEAFLFEHPELTVCWKTLEKYIEENPTEFPPILRQNAEVKRYKHWLGEGKTLMQGKYKNGSPHVWQACMRNMFRHHGWGESTSNSFDKSNADRMYDKITNGDA